MNRASHRLLPLSLSFILLLTLSHLVHGADLAQHHQVVKVRHPDQAVNRVLLEIKEAKMVKGVKGVKTLFLSDWDGVVVEKRRRGPQQPKSESLTALKRLVGLPLQFSIFTARGKGSFPQDPNTCPRPNYPGPTMGDVLGKMAGEMRQLLNEHHLTPLISGPSLFPPHTAPQKLHPEAYDQQYFLSLPQPLPRNSFLIHSGKIIFAGHPRRVVAVKGPVLRQLVEGLPQQQRPRLIFILDDSPQQVSSLEKACRFFNPAQTRCVIFSLLTP